MRNKKLSGELPPHVFYQLKDIFQILETLGSARIEGNHTILSEHVDKVIKNKPKTDEPSVEIHNLKRAIDFIESNIKKDSKIDNIFISELHKIITEGLTLPPGGEGSVTPGELRKHNVIINSSKHKPVDYIRLPEFNEEFVKFINSEYKDHNQLLMVAVANHRFSYIHPFDNGNGRLGRLLNYALLIKLGFNVDNGRIINPSAVFYSDRGKYYDMLAKADSLSEEDVLSWSKYFLSGLKNEITKIDYLLDKEYVQKKIILPALNYSWLNQHITEKEFKILKLITSKSLMQIRSQDLSEVGVLKSVEKSRAIKKLKDKKILRSSKEGGRVYTISFVDNILLRGMIDSFMKEGYIAEFLNT